MLEKALSGKTGIAGGRVERLLGRPPGEWTVDDFSSLAQEQGIRVVSLMHVGGDGWLKTLDFLPSGEEHLRDILVAGERADGSSLFSDTGIAPDASDIVLRPRLDTAFLNPFSPCPTLAFLCEHRGRNGDPLPQSPYTIVCRAFDRIVREMGIELWAHAEVEYFLGKEPDRGDVYGTDDRGYHATAPFVFGEGLRRQAMMILGDLGIAVKYGHSEVGYIEANKADGHLWEQHEIELALAPLPAAADAVVLSQWVLRNLAHERGMQCSFKPVLLPGHAGSGMHFHLSPKRGEEHLGSIAEEGTLADEARWLIAGLVRYGGALMAFGNRTWESFTRLRQGKEAPQFITWGEFDRRALVRLPLRARTTEGKTVSPPTIEFRLPDGSVHPHLLLSGVAQVMLRERDRHDLDELLDATHSASREKCPGGASPVPHNFEEVAACMEEHRRVLEAGGVFPEEMIEKTIEHTRGAGQPHSS